MSDFRRGTRVSLGPSPVFPDMGEWKGTVEGNGVNPDGTVTVRLDAEFCVFGPNDGGLVDVPADQVALLPKRLPRVVPGQIWRDCDVRMTNRTVCVQRVDDQYAYCVLVNPVTHEPISTRTIRLLLRRMKPGSTGWQLIS